MTVPTTKAQKNAKAAYKRVLLKLSGEEADDTVPRAIASVGAGVGMGLRK